MFILDSDKQQVFIHPGKVSCTFELNEGQYTDIENSLLMHVTRFLLEQKKIAKRISVKNYFSCWQDSYLLLYCSLFKCCSLCFVLSLKYSIKSNPSIDRAH